MCLIVYNDTEAGAKFYYLGEKGTEKEIKVTTGKL
jgi:hypothetical protein